MSALPIPVGLCGTCGKRDYVSRKAARRAARDAHPGDRLTAYACPDGTGYWHYGHNRAWRHATTVDETQTAVVTKLHRSAPQTALAQMAALAAAARATSQETRVDPA